MKYLKELNENNDNELGNDYLITQLKEMSSKGYARISAPKFVEFLKNLDQNQRDIIFDVIDEYGLYKYSEGYDSAKFEED